MANRHRGEIAAELDGRARTLVLTLGALAELEDAFGAQDLVALTERFGRGRLSARDAMRIIVAGLRGAGESVTEDEVARMTTPGGAAGFARIVGDLLAATFGAAPEPAGEGARPAHRERWPVHWVGSRDNRQKAPHPNPLPDGERERLALRERRRHFRHLTEAARGGMLRALRRFVQRCV